MRIKIPAFAKITHPVYSDILLRKRLFKQLDSARKRHIVWICGPPGAGKTTLVSSYIEARGLPCIWYQVDAGDAETASFFYYMGLAVKKISRHRRNKDLPLLTPEYTLSLPVFTRRYFEDLYSRLKPPSLLVFDNYQDAPSDSLFHEMLRDGMEIIPEGVNIIFISRSEPPPAFARIRTNRLIELIGWDALQLTPEESEGIAKFKLGKGKSKKVLPRDIFPRTKGWMAGLILMLEQAGNEGIAPPSMRGMQWDTIFDYFASEIFNNLDTDTRTFLLKTSLLPEMDSQMVERLTGIDNSVHILADLCRKNCFTERYLYSNPVYQYHPLFREFLLSRAKDTFSTAEINRLQRMAAQVLEESGRFEDSFGLMQKSSDWHGITGLVVKYAQSLIMQGRNKLIEEWITSVPNEILNNTPWLLYWLGISRMPFNPIQSRTHLEKAFQLFDEQKDVVGVFLTWCAIVDTFVWACDTYIPLEHWIKTLLLLLDKYKLRPHAEIEDRVVATMFNAMALQMPHHPEISLWERRAKKTMRHTSDNNLRILIGYHLFQYYGWLGEEARARSLNDEMQPLIHSSRVSPLLQILWCTQEAIFGWLMGSVDNSLSVVEKGLKLAEISGIHLYDSILLSQGIYGSVTIGDYDRASEYLKRTTLPLDMSPPIRLSHYLFQSAIVALGKGDIRYAIEQVEVSLGILRERGLPFGQAINHIALANAYIEIGQYDTATGHIVSAYDIGCGMKSKNLEYMCSLSNAHLAMVRGDETECLKLVHNAMTMARENGIVNIFYTHRPVMVRLCAKALEAGIEVEHVKKIIKRSNLIPDVPMQYIESWPWPVKIYTLGRFMILKDDIPLKFPKKTQQRPLDLLKTAIALGGRDVSEGELTDTLWPDMEGDAAHHVFEMNLSRLRQLLGYANAIELRNSRLTIDPGYCWVDLWAFERLMGEIDKQVKSGNIENAVPLFEKAIRMYQGGFLAGDEDNPSVISTQEHLKDHIRRHIEDIGCYLEQTGQVEKAIRCFVKGLEVDDLFEAFYQRLMVCYQRLGRRAEALALYNRLKKTLSTTFAIEPSSKTENIYKAIRSDSTPD